MTEETKASRYRKQRVPLSERPPEEQAYLEWLTTALFDENHPDHHLAYTALIEDFISLIQTESLNSNWNGGNVIPGRERHTTPTQAQRINEAKSRSQNEDEF